MNDEMPWVAVMVVYRQYGYKSASAARNAVAAGRFPVPTYKLGKLIVIDRLVHEGFFSKHRESGLLAMRNNKTDGKQPGGSE